MKRYLFISLFVVICCTIFFTGNVNAASGATLSIGLSEGKFKISGSGVENAAKVNLKAEFAGNLSFVSFIPGTGVTATPNTQNGVVELTINPSTSGPFEIGTFTYNGVADANNNTITLTNIYVTDADGKIYSVENTNVVQVISSSSNGSSITNPPTNVSTILIPIVTVISLAGVALLINKKKVFIF